MKSVAIIGGGFSGCITAVQVLKKNPDIAVTIINSGHPIGKGVAYDIHDPRYSLNVPVAKMSAFENRPFHFQSWLLSRENYSEFHDQEFLPREVYSAYLDFVFGPWLKSGKIKLIDSTATNIKTRNGKHAVFLANGSIVEADFIVLAMGNYLPGTPKGIPASFLGSKAYSKNPWDNSFLKKLKGEENILLIGTGLTMVDYLGPLRNNGHKGKIYVCSPRGYVPQPHLRSETYPDFYSEIKGKDLLSILKIIRVHIGNAASRGIAWQAVIDSIRPYAKNIWTGFSEKEKQQFISHVRHIWGMARHRLPRPVHANMQGMLMQGQMEMIAGRIKNIEQSGDNVKVIIQTRRDQRMKKILVDRVVNCTGPQLNFRESEEPLIKNLLNSGFILPDNLKMGLKATVNGNVIRKDGISKTVFAIGPLLRGTLWETTAVPEIRQQAEHIAKLINS